MGRMISSVCHFVCLSVCVHVCPRCKRKTAWATDIKVGRYIVHSRPSESTLRLEVKRSKVKVIRLSSMLRAWVCTTIRLHSFLVDSICLVEFAPYTTLFLLTVCCIAATYDITRACQVWAGLLQLYRVVCVESVVDCWRSEENCRQVTNF